jgi:hypothetical protein
MRPGENPAKWMREVLDGIGAVPFKHPGKFKYAIALGVTRADRKAVLIAGARDHTAYPKKDIGQLEFDLFGPDTLGTDHPVGLVLRSSRPPGRPRRLVRGLAAEPGGLGAPYCLGAVIDLEFGEDVADVVADGLG